jgi:hypothetical protein
MRQRIAIIVLELLLSLLLLSSGALAEGRPLAPLDAVGSGAPPQGPMVMVGQIGGGTTAVAVQGNTAYVGLGVRLVTLDITDPAQPLFRGQSELIPGGVSGIAITGTVAYVAALEGGVYAVDVSDPGQPAIVGHYDDMDEATGLAVTVVVEGSYVYVAYGDAGLCVLQINDGRPSSDLTLTKVGSLTVSGSFFEDMVLSGSRLYVTDLISLRILDVSDPTSPTEVGSWGVAGLGKGTSGVAVALPYAYVGTQWLYGSTLSVLDVTNPANPSEVGSVNLQSSGGRVTTAGNYVYISIAEDGVETVDVSVPGQPQSVSVYDTPGYPQVLAVAEGKLHIADECGSYRIASLATPAQPADLGVYTSVGCVTRVAASGSYAYINSSSGLAVVNVPADPAQAAVVGALSGPVAGLETAGSHLYVANGTGLRVVDVSTPAAPAQVGYLALTGKPAAVAIQGSYAYVTGENTGLGVIDITNPINPTLKGSRTISGAGQGVAVSGNTACVAGGSAGLRVIDVTNPASPGTPATLDTPGTASEVAIAGSLAYVADMDGGLRIVDISSPASPAALSFYTDTWQVSGVAVADDYAYLADGYGGVSLIDVSEPTALFEFTSYSTLDLAEDVCLVGDLLYVADGVGGLIIFRITLPTPINHPLGEAWNLFSFNVEPISPTVPLTDVQAILLSIDGQYTSVLGYDQGGRSYYPDLDPEFNDLKELDWQHGYWIKMRQEDTLRIKGWPVDPTSPLALDRGWNLVSYLPGEPISVTVALASIADKYTAVLGFHDGSARSYYADLSPDFNDLKCLRPQNGYWIKTTEATTLTYPSTGLCTEAAPSAASSGAKRTLRRTALPAIAGALSAQAAPKGQVRSEAQPAPAEQVMPTSQWWDVYSADTRCAGAPVVEGTIIQAYDPQGVPCGYAVAHSVGQWGVMHVYGDDSTTPADEGAEPGDVISFTINGQPAQVSGQATWQDRARQQVDLTSSSCGPYIHLPTVQ